MSKKKNKIIPLNKKQEKAIVTLAVGPENCQYFIDQQRLIESLLVNGETEVFMAKYEHATFGSVYNDKITHIKHAGDYFKKIIWLDCAVTTVDKLDAIWEYIEKNGVYLVQSGTNCSEICNDNCLKQYGLTRDTSASIPEVSASAVGINLEHPTGKKFFNLWIDSLKNDANLGHKNPTLTQRLGESLDARFKQHKQDQSTCSLAAHFAGVYLDKGRFVGKEKQSETIFII